MKRLSPFFLFLVLCALPRTAQGLTISAPGEVSLNSGDFVDVSLGAAGIPSDATGFTFSVSGLPSGVTSAITFSVATALVTLPDEFVTTTQ